MTKHNDFIEQLTEIATVSGFWSLSCDELAEGLDLLIERVFRQPNFALKSVVDSLFEHQGPLAERSVKMKLLLGLGVISAELYHDLTCFFEHRTSLADDTLSFSSEPFLAAAQQLHSADLSLIDELRRQLEKTDAAHTMQRQMLQLRLERMVRSSLILAVVAMLEQLDSDSPL